MTLALSILMNMDARQAKAELAATGREITKTGGAADRAQRAGQGLQRTTSQVGGAFTRAGRGARDYAAGLAMGARDAFRAADSAQLAGGSIANLGAQFNDIGVMLAAGQSPMQLAIQQGTQITQVIGPLGAAGAVKALGTAFLSLINPVSIATIGIIAGGAALTQWAFSSDEAEESADSLEARLASLTDTQTQLNRELRGMRLGVTADELTLIDAVAEKLTEVNRIRTEMEGVRGGARGDRQTALGPRLNEAQAELAALQTQLQALRALQAEKELLTTTTRETADAERLLGEQMIQATAQRAQATIAAQALFAELQGQAEIQRLISVYGADSAQVAQARAAAEREAKAEQIQAMNVSAEMKQQLLAALDAAQGIASVGMAGNIAAASSEAAVLAQQLGISLGLAQQIAGIGQAAGDGNTFSGFEGNDPRNPDSTAPIFTNPRSFNSPGFRPGRSRGGGGGGGGGGAASALAEANAIQQLISRLEEQLAVARETDPVQKEMIRNRETLEGATEAERAKVEELIRARITEAEAIEQATARAQFYGDIGEDALNRLIVKGESLEDVIKNVALQFIDAALQAQLFGSGPFGGGSSLLDLIFPSSAAPLPLGAASPLQQKSQAALEAFNGTPRRAANTAAAPAGAQGNAGGGGPAYLEATISLDGARGDREIEEAASKGMRRALEEFSRDVLPVRVGEINSRPRRVG